MLVSVAYLLLAAGYATVAHAKSNCPVYGPLFPAPKHMKDSPRLKAVTAELNDMFDQKVKEANASFSFVFQAYSVDEGVIWENKFTDPRLKAQLANSTGVKEADADTVHRVGSITKTFTVMAFLKEVGVGVWFDPITKYIPELRELSAEQKGKPSVYHPNWDEITVGSLITFQSGLMRDCMPENHSSRLNGTI
jgi:CubicO group peptidase (beta-lactamase class C family)